MSRWIDADALEPIIVWQDYEGYITTYSDADIENAPSIDIVRCKECKYGRNIESEWICEHLSGLAGLNVLVNADDFCSYGESEGE